MDLGEVRQSTDVDELWQALRAAKDRGDGREVAAIEQRMRELSATTRFEHLDDDELDRQIAALQAQREPEVPQRYSPPGSGMSDGITFTMEHNRASRAQQHVGIERTLADLLDERRRRRGEG